MEEADIFPCAPGLLGQQVLRHSRLPACLADVVVAYIHPHVTARLNNLRQMAIGLRQIAEACLGEPEVICDGALLRQVECDVRSVREDLCFNLVSLQYELHSGAHLADEIERRWSQVKPIRAALRGCPWTLAWEAERYGYASCALAAWGWTADRVASERARTQQACDEAAARSESDFLTTLSSPGGILSSAFTPADQYWVRDVLACAARMYQRDEEGTTWGDECAARLFFAPSICRWSSDREPLAFEDVSTLYPRLCAALTRWRALFLDDDARDDEEYEDIDHFVAGLRQSDSRPDVRV